MLKKRIVACITVKDNVVVQSIGFQKYLPVGSLPVAVEFLNQWGIDEIAIIDISARRGRRKPNFALLAQVVGKCLTPLAIGGGIASIADMRRLNQLGAEKVVINCLALRQREIITEAAQIFGSQFVVVSIDAKKIGRTYEVFSDSGTHATGLEVASFARSMENLGAGEIFLNSIDRDGSKRGFDVNLINRVAERVRIPIIAIGGAGTANHFYEALTKTKASAVAAGNFFHFTEHSPIVLKSFLRSRGAPVRLETYAQYDGAAFDALGRLKKCSEQYLDKLRFTYLPEEII